MKARIHVVGGPRAGETMEIGAGKLIIGREEDCHLRPDSEFISRHHCVLLLDDYTLRVRDLGSKNGTFVNGDRVGTGETILRHGDGISVGEMTFVIDLNEGGDSPSQGKQASPSTQALDGTGIFDGTTAPSVAKPIIPPVSPSERWTAGHAASRRRDD
jgi:pSer/pThr/pTyr-binding forkhead associated (FHA) protein